MIDPRYKAVGFDMDGTLLDTHIDYEKLGNAEFDTLVSLGVPPECVNTHLSDAEMIRNGVKYLNEKGKSYTFDSISELVNKRAEDIELESVDTAEAFEGAYELLMKLKENRYRIGLLTRGQRKYAVDAMTKCNLIGFMDTVEAYDDHPTGEQKPNPIAMEYLAKGLGVRVEEILYIGDSVWDYYCARDSGAGFIGIAGGENGKRKWADHREIKLVDTVKDLL